MTPDNALSQLFPSEPRQSRTPEATDSPATVELRPVLQRRIAAPASYPVEVIDEPLDQKGIEPERETKSPPLAHRLPVDTPVMSERIIDRVLVERTLGPPHARATDDVSAPAPKSDPRAVTGETQILPPGPSRPADLLAQKSPSINVAQPAQPRDESPPAPKLSDHPVSVQVQQGSRSEKTPDRRLPHDISAPTDSQEPERKTVVLQPVIHAESPQASEPERKDEKAEARPRVEKPEPPDQPGSVKVAVPPKAEESGEGKIEQIATQADLKPATPLAALPVSRAEPVLTPLPQPQANTDSPSNRQPSPGGVTLRIGTIQITSRGKTSQRPPTTRRPARSHKIEPRLPFASGRW
jgi:nicotinate-nucleotide--dimethylbenzimidazole phosphoribosyltransferase